MGRRLLVNQRYRERPMHTPTHTHTHAHRFPAILSTKPLVFSPPSREAFPFRFCPPYAVCCDAQGAFGDDGLARLQRRAERWRTARRLQADLAEVDKLLAAVA